jgi:putative addiction module component (TIGR02574 family)
MTNGYVMAVPITLEQIVEEARRWPPEKVGELVERLTEDLHSGGSETDAAWREEIARRVEDIRSARVSGIPGDKASSRARRMLRR